MKKKDERIIQTTEDLLHIALFITNGPTLRSTGSINLPINKNTWTARIQIK